MLTALMLDCKHLKWHVRFENSVELLLEEMPLRPNEK